MGSTPALSREPDFSTSAQEWIIAVKMVSEGVDIPRLRVGVYATNVITQLFFTQFVGRFVRWIKGLPEQTAYVYIPEDPRIAACAYNIAQERNHAVDEAAQEDSIEEDDDEYIDPVTEKPVSFFQPIRSEAEHNGAIVDNDKIPPQELDFVRPVAEKFGMSPEVMARARRIFMQEVAPLPQTTIQEPRPVFREAQSAKKRINTFAKAYARMAGLEVKDVHKLWMQRGGKAHRASDLNDLNAKEQWLKDLVDQWSKNRGQSTA